MKWGKNFNVKLNVLHWVMQVSLVVKLIGSSKSSFQRIIKRFEETSDFHDWRRSDRPKRLNDRNIRMLKRLTENNARYSSYETANKLNNSLKNPMYKITVITYLHKNGYEYKTKIKKVIPYRRTEKTKDLIDV